MQINPDFSLEMDQFSEEHGKLLLSKEWLAKNNNSTPYLFKCYFSTVDLSCFIMMTDTRSIWTEVLNSKQFARRWRACNPGCPYFAREEEEDEWRIYNLQLLAKAHTLGGVDELSFDCVESNYADIAVELECEAFKWRWEVSKEGARLSAELISKHLVLPLISLNHLACSSAVGESSETDLEKAVDKVGRTARRSVDTHVKNAMSKPRVATALRRITAMFNFIPELPAILVTSEKPELRAQAVPTTAWEASLPVSSKPRGVSPDPIPATPPTQAASLNRFSQEISVSKNPDPADSATEDDSEDEAPPVAAKGKDRVLPSSSSPPPKIKSLSPAPRPRSPSLVSSKPLRRAKSPQSDSDSSPVRPVKKAKSLQSDSDSSPVRPVKKAKPSVSSSDEDSEAERKRRLARATSGIGGGKRGTKQPIKRGGKRF